MELQTSPASVAPQDGWGAAARRFLRESRGRMGRFALCLLAAAAAGAALGTLLEPQEQDRFIRSLYRDPSIKELGAVPMFFVIFINNFMISCAMIGASLFARAVPWIVVGINGLVIGMVVAMTARQLGLGRVLLAIAPHGIIELPAIIAAAAVGLTLGAWRRLPPSDAVPAADLRWLARCGGIVALMLLVAAFLETAVTPALLGIDP